MTDTRAQQCRGGSSAGAMLLVLIISRGLERSTDAALVVAEHERALDEVRHGRRVSKYTGNPLVLCIIRIEIILKLIMYSSR